MSTQTASPTVAPGVDHSNPASNRVPRGILGLTMVFTGAAGLIYEYVLSTVFSYLLGNSIEQFSITIGLMFLMMGVGGILQLRFRSSLVEIFIAAELLLVALGGFAPIAMQWAFVAFPDDFAWMKFIYTCAIGLLIGIEIPLVMRINERFTASLGGNIASTWAWDYIGGALGVVLWIVLLRAFVPITHISFIVAGCNLVVAVMSLVFFWRRGMFSRPRLNVTVASAAAIMTVVVLVLGYGKVDSWSTLINQRLYSDPIVSSVTTKYQNIVVTKGAAYNDAPDGSYTLWLNGNKQFSSSDEAIYHEYLVHPAMNVAGSRDRVLVLGGGDGLALREILKYDDVSDVTLVDLDPGMIKLASEDPVLSELNMGAFRDARVRDSFEDPLLVEGVQDSGLTAAVEIETDEPSDPTQTVAEVNVYTVDADRFLSEARGPWDVVIVDLPDPNSVELAKLYSKEFYEKIQRTLAPGGIVVVQSTSPYHAKETFLCINRTLQAAGLATLPYHDNVPSFGDWGWIIGSADAPAAELNERMEQLQDFPVETREIQAATVQRALTFNKGWLETANTEVSTLMKPVVFSYYTYEAWKVE